MPIRASDSPTRLVCSGCGWEPPAGEPYPFRCWHADARDDVDHLLARRVDLDAIATAQGADTTEAARAFWHSVFLDDEPNPFVRYRVLLHSYQMARARGMSDAQYVTLARDLDEAAACVDGTGFRETPFAPVPALSSAVAATVTASTGSATPLTLWVKDETRNVSGSHKARHLMGIALWMAAWEGATVRTAAAAPAGAGAPSAPLAIASCGNAALAAAVVARAIDRPLRVFIPTDAHPNIVERLRALGALLEVCPRQPGVPGDPTLHAFREAVQTGALPFCCQGNENGLTIEGGMTLGWEIASHLARTGASLDRLFVQVGGGALATSVALALHEAVQVGVLSRMPRVHAVQTVGGHPLQRAYDRVAAHVAQQLESRASDPGASPIEQALSYASTHRREFMWPWETPPHSIAHGILDDETYDWLAIVRAMLHTGGGPVVVDEPTLREANELACRFTGIPVDPTGSAGLAGCLTLARAGRPGAGAESAGPVAGGSRAGDQPLAVGVLFTGVTR